MLRKAADLQNLNVLATDAEIGHVEELYFDDESWIVRYLVVNTGDWMSGRNVLISGNSIGAAQWDEHKILVKQTRAEVENAPGIETHRPVTRRHEAALYDYYGFPYYWGAPGGFGMALNPIWLPPVEGPAPAEEPESPEASHLQSTRDVAGFHIDAADGEIGHVEDFIIDDETWTIRYVEVDTRNWWPGKKVLLAPSWIQQIDEADGKVHVKLLRQVIQDAPEYDHSVPISREYEVALFDHYGQYLESQGSFRYWLPEDLGE